MKKDQEEDEDDAKEVLITFVLSSQGDEPLSLLWRFNIPRSSGCHS